MIDRLEELSFPVVRSPFSQVFATGYYDGPTEGLIDCRDGGMSYVFRMLDWDDAQDLRVFSLAESPVSAREWLGEGRSGHRVMEVSAMSDVQLGQVEALLSIPPTFVMAAWGILGELVACRHVVWESVRSVNDWFEWLGIERGRRTD